MLVIIYTSHRREPVVRQSRQLLLEIWKPIMNDQIATKLVDEQTSDTTNGPVLVAEPTGAETALGLFRNVYACTD
jgi:hypothetical protein